MSTYILNKKVSLTAYLFYFSLTLASAQGQFTDREELAYQATFELNTAQTLSLLEDSQRPSSLYLKHLALTIDFLITENPTTYNSLLDKEEAYIEEIERMGEDPWRDFAIAEIKLRKAFINAKVGNELSAAWQLRQAYKLIVANNEAYPEFEPNKKTLGLLHILIGSIPDQYQWVVGLLGMEGNIITGMKELQEVAQGNSGFKLEAQLMTAAIQAYLLNQTTEASHKILSLYDRNKGNELIAYIAVAILLKNSEAKKAEEIFVESSKHVNPLMHYLAGELYLQLGKYAEAEENLLKFTQLFMGSNFIKDAYYKLFVAYWLQGKPEKADQYHIIAQRTGQTLTEADKHADKQLKKNEYPNKIIMQIRLFTDGGEYAKAEKIVINTDTATFTAEDKLEFVYRKARLNHKVGNQAKAIALYKQVTKLQQGKQYFAPNSCLQLGYLYKQMQKPETAIEWFEKTLTYSNFEYKNSIDNKAKAALKELR